ncbi:MAG: hypothetical protein ACK4SF_12395 [Algoriphagus aquaeductus]|jgi:hypothetical protein|uniref:hypothetical protein n=1 Tax=Algoriphagus TaxID=246875 RepID=UPI00258ABCF9|nr:hypothetical protein [Algoriphagus sp.]
MKKLSLLFLILLSCNIIPPEPSDFTLEEVTVVGGPILSVQDSVGLLIVLNGLPPTNEWKMSWEIDGQELFTEDVSGKSGKYSSLKKYRKGQPGNFVFRGCISSKNMKVCQEEPFTIR